MLEGKETTGLSSSTVVDWMIKEEPKLVKKIHDHFLKTDLPVSFDSIENTKRLAEVTDFLLKNSSEIYNTLNIYEKLLIYIMKNGFGWIVYDQMESTLKIISKIFRFDYEGLLAAVDSLFKKFLIFKFERLKKYSFFFCPPAFLKNIDVDFVAKEVFGEAEYDSLDQQDLLTSQYLPLIAGFMSYVVTYSPRSSETNEIHKIDLDKMLEFFADFAERETLEQIIKKLSRFGFFQKFNNRIIINKTLFDSIMNLSINEQLFVIFLYDFMNKFDFKKSAFMTLKLLASRTHQHKKPIPLRELFFYYLNNEIYISLKNDSKNLKLLIQQEELKFMFFVKSLESENIAILSRSDPRMISLGKDTILMNEPHTSLLNNVDFTSRFIEDKFIVETNYEVIAEPNIRPDILFRLSIIAEPQTIQTISIFKITKESIYRSLAYGVQKEDILNFLKDHSRHIMPENVEEGIRSFISSLSMEKLENYKIIQISAHSSTQVRDNFKNQLIEVEPHTFLVFDPVVLKSIEDFCKSQKISHKYITDFLSEKYQSSLISNPLSHNIKHLHTMKDFFDFYGSEPSGTNLRIDNSLA